MIYLWFFIIGLVFGSFTNVLIYRFASHSDFWRKRSFCPKCNKILHWYELFPLLSFLIQQGKCRGCRTKISWRYPIVELLMGLLFVVGYWYFGVSLFLLKYFIFCIFGVALAFIDGWKKEVPDELSLPLFFLLCLMSVFINTDWQKMVIAIIVGVGFFAVMHYASRGQWMGDGDIRLGAIMAVLIGNVFGFVVALGIASISASIYGVTRNALIHKWVHQIAFGPFLLFGAWLSLFLPPALILKMVTII